MQTIIHYHMLKLHFISDGQMSSKKVAHKKNLPHAHILWYSPRVTMAVPLWHNNCLIDNTYNV